MDTKIRNFSTIAEFNDVFGVETLHPSVSVIDMSKSGPIRHLLALYDFYAIFLKETDCGGVRYGRRFYDYSAGTLVCIGPGQVYGVADDGTTFQPLGHVLLFHPDFVRGSSLGSHMGDYAFFSYRSNESLHMTESERLIVLGCFSRIGQELELADDASRDRLISKNIELLLDYCLRFHDRQFANPHNEEKDLLVRFQAVLDDYFSSGRAADDGVPTVKRCAEVLCLSANYFGDLFKRETGRTAQEYIRLSLVERAKEQLFDPSKSISEVAYSLGFKYPQHFTRLFKRICGVTPDNWRRSQIY
ncbi:MAG: helix-turn-helix transcriptional regulator [Alistipes sp.]|nr:helix-turn-helix transcriptional regulator [Alistipes sp.]